MRAEKGNKVYTIGEADKKRYQSDGFDIYQDNKLIASGQGKTVSSEEYEKLVKENAGLKEKLKEAEGSSDGDEVTRILMKYAEEHGINVGRAQTVQGIVKKIRENLPDDDPALEESKEGSE